MGIAEPETRSSSNGLPVLERPRLLSRLDRAWRVRLSVLSAPAGFGKTRLVEGWAAAQTAPVVWLDVEPADSDPVRLWSRICAGVSSATERRPDSVAAGAKPAESVRLLIDEVCGLVGGEDGVAIVLDDLHLVGGAAMESIELALRRLPARVHLIVLSRVSPGLGLARLRNRRALVELGPGQLAFTVAEVGRLLGRIGVLNGEDRVIHELARRTEGWPAAVYLSALWLRDRPHPHAALGSVATVDQQLVEYLSGQVLDATDLETRQFMVRTSPLAHLSGRLADDILETSGSELVLRELRASNLLVTELPGRPGWYRYHAILRDFLQRRLERQAPGAAAELHRRAMQWYLNTGRFEEAGEHALAGHDAGTLTTLLAAHHLDLARVGRSATLVRWESAVPDDLLARDPSAAIGSLYAHQATGSAPSEMKRLLAAAETARAVGGHAWGPYHEASFQLFIATYADRGATEAVRAAELAVSICHQQVPQLAVIAGAILALAQDLSGDSDAAERTARGVVDRPEAPQRPFGHVSAWSTLSVIELQRGNVTLARAHVNRAVEAVRIAGIEESPSAARAQTAEALVSAHEGRLAHAERAARLALAQTNVEGLLQIWMLLALAEIRARRGQQAPARGTLKQAEELLLRFPDAGRLPDAAQAITRALQASADDLHRPQESLSRAELRVLALWQSGLSRREIADSLVVSVNTVKSHLRAIYRKLGVKSRADAAARAQHLGLAPPRDGAPGTRRPGTTERREPVSSLP
jgi:LuxR family transcriptional regulator, maltose regulon positive regulatory protein